MNFKRWLERSPYTPATLAVLLGVTRQTVYTWINGEKIPKPANLKRLRVLSDGALSIESFPALNDRA